MRLWLCALGGEAGSISLEMKGALIGLNWLLGRASIIWVIAGDDAFRSVPPSEKYFPVHLCHFHCVFGHFGLVILWP